MALFIINCIRSIMRKEIIVLGQTDQTEELLGIAYYYERKKNFEKAITYYRLGLLEEKDSHSYALAIIRLRLGFCLSIIGKKLEAKNEYSYVMNNYPHEDIAFTAFLLLNYLERFEKEIDKVKNEESNLLAKSEKLYNLIAFKEALELLETEEDIENHPEKNKIKYFIGRCHEELGETLKAFQVYQEIIVDDPDSQQAKLSNKRIFTNGVAYFEDEGIVDLAKKNNKLIKDPSFNTLVENAEVYNVVNNSPITGNEEKIENKKELEIETFIRESNEKIEKEISAARKEETVIVEKEKEKEIELIEKQPQNEFVTEYDKDGKKVKSVYYNEKSELFLTSHSTVKTISPPRPVSTATAQTLDFPGCSVLTKNDPSFHLPVPVPVQFLIPEFLIQSPGSFVFLKYL